MSRIGLAFSCFFKLLFGGKLPASAAAYLPEDALPKPLPAGKPDKGVVAPMIPVAPTLQPADAPAPKPKVSAAQQHRDGALAFLALLQREGRLVDFVRESLDTYTDADIGAAARDVHRGCRKVLDQHLTLEAVMPGAEEDKVSVPKGFDPGEIRLVGEAKGEPPFRGTLRHHGWRVTETKLPALAEGVDRAVIAPAEVEISA